MQHAFLFKGDTVHEKGVSTDLVREIDGSNEINMEKKIEPKKDTVTVRELKIQLIKEKFDIDLKQNIVSFKPAVENLQSLNNNTNVNESPDTSCS